MKSAVEHADGSYERRNYEALDYSDAYRQASEWLAEPSVVRVAISVRRRVA